MKKTDNNTWDELLLKVGKQFNVLADFSFLLFLVGIQERGKGYISYSKEEKTDLINMARCVLFERAGYYKQSGNDEEGWPTFDVIQSLEDKLPSEREDILKATIVDYYNEQLVSE